MVSFSSFLNELSSLFLHGPWCGRGGKGGGGELSYERDEDDYSEMCNTLCFLYRPSFSQNSKL